MACPRCPAHVSNSSEVTSMLIASSILSLLQPNHPLNKNSIDYYKDGVHNIQDSYDFIVVGGGAAGSAVFNRISQNPAFKVLLLEAGEAPPFISEIPGFAEYLTSLNHPYQWNYTAEPEPEICQGIVGGRCPFACGKVLGGSTSLNGMYYLRGTRYDYDNWAARGNTGWSYPEVVEYFRKSEDQRSETVYELPDSMFYHSSAGDLTVVDPYKNIPYTKELLKAARNVHYHNVSDFNRNYTVGFGFYQYTIRHGVRCSAAEAFLKSLRYRMNIDLVTNALVTRVNINNTTKIAEGVTFVLDGKVRTVNVTKEVILSAGAFNTPKILMLSGVGRKEHLKELGIEPVVTQSNVGDNLKAHVLHYGLYYCMNKTVNKVPDISLKEVFDTYFESGSGPMTENGYSFGGFIKITNDTNLKNYTDIGVLYSLFTGDRNSTDEYSDLMQFNDEIREGLAKLMEECDLILVRLKLLHPKSTGTVRLRDSKIESSPMIRPNYLTDERDVDTLVEGLIKMKELGENIPGVKEVSHLRIGKCDDLTPMTSEYWKCAMPYVTRGDLYGVGTCKMGPDSDASAVVDPNLRVRGVNHLVVADESVMPDIVSGDVSISAMMIGEKAASILSRRWWLGVPTDRSGVRVLYPQGMIM